MKHIKKHPILSGFLIFLTLLVLAAVLTGAVIMDAADGSTGEFKHLIVLGTAVNGTEPSLMLADRIEAAGNYLEENQDVMCIVSGYQSGEGNISEAQCMYNELTEMGIAPDRIIMEDKATSTEENLEYSLALIEEISGSRPETVGILSSEMHLYRASMFADEQDVTAYMIPAETSDTGTFIYYFIREIVLVWYYSVF